MIKNKLKIILVVVALIFLSSFGLAFADTYSADTTVALTSPAVNLTILASSSATSIVVNAGSVVVTVPASGTFIITSTDKDLNYSGQTQNSVISTNCSASFLETLTISATSGSSETITITPNSSACTIPVVTSGRGNSVFIPKPVITPIVVAASNINTNTNNSPVKYDLGNQTLKNGSKGEAVKELQRFLNDKLKLGLVLDGKLGPKTITVIKKWQKDNGLKPDGLIGSKTKALMNK